MKAARRAVLRAFVAAGIRLLLQFGLVFYGVDALTALRPDRHALYMAWELALPYWPWTYPVYASVLLMPFLVPALARDARQLRQWERRMSAAIWIAGAVFLLLPAQRGYAPADPGAWHLWTDATALVTGRYNMLPSLHAALGLITTLSVWSTTGRAGRAALAAWTLAMMTSTLTTHQHHVADLLSGIALALLVQALARWRERRMLARDLPC